MKSLVFFFCSEIEKFEKKECTSHSVVLRSAIAKRVKLPPNPKDSISIKTVNYNDPLSWMDGDIQLIAEQITNWMMSSYLRIESKELISYSKVSLARLFPPPPLPSVAGKERERFLPQRLRSHFTIQLPLQV